MLHIWFNRTYATNVHTIALLRGNPGGEPVRIFGTHVDLDSPMLGACDVAELEPGEEVTGLEYVDWALQFCARHKIEVFIPRLHLDVLAGERKRFTDAGVVLVAGPSGPAALLEDKDAAYADALAAGVAVPPWRVVSSGQELVQAYHELAEEVGEVCLKPVRGVGGNGFRRLTTQPLTLEELLDQPSPRAQVHEAAAALDAHRAAGGAVPPLMLLPFLSGPEVSVDCLADEEGTVLAAVPRTKLSRRRLLVDDPGAVEVAARIIARHRLYSLSNTQVRYWRHPQLDAAPRPYLLETNARISGGLYQTALAGVNLPWAAVLLALGRPVPELRLSMGVAFTTVSGTVALGS